MTGDAVRIIGYRLRELSRGRNLVAMGQIPSSPAFLTPEWLTNILCSDQPGAVVTDFQVTPGSSGTSARNGLIIRYNAAGTAAQLPTALYIKSTPDLKTRLMCGLSKIAVAEAGFYNLIRPGLNIETPNAYYANYNLRDGRSILILDDLVATRGANFADPRVTYIDRTKAEEMVTLMATYHGTFWDRPELRTLAWLRDAATFQYDMNDSLNFSRMVRNGLKRARHVIPSLNLRARDIWEIYLQSLNLKITGPLTLVHQDVHTRNWYITDKGCMGLYDWQAIAAGSWAIDLAYALSGSLTIADRRAWEVELLELYLDKLAYFGISSRPSWDDAWLRYRQQMMHGMVLWIGTIGLSSLQPVTQPRDVCLTHIERMSQAAVDLDTLNLCK